MQATDLDKLVPCWICDGSGDDPVQNTREVGDTTEYAQYDGTWGEEPAECRFCEADGQANHYGPNHPGSRYSGNHVIMVAEIRPNGGLFVSPLAISQPTGGFDERYGPGTVTPPDHFQPDMKDQLQNRPLGTNGPYTLADDDVYEGAEVSASHLPGDKWPADGDLSIEQTLAWLRARNNPTDAARLETIRDRLNL